MHLTPPPATPSATARHPSDRVGLLGALVGDGRPLIVLTAIALLFSGCFALFLSAAGQFLPHDLAYLGMSAEQLCALGECRVVAFMMHDRASFGGVLVAIGTLYLWLSAFPLRRGEGWAWWTLAMSGAVGFASFLGWLGYGYLDTWHGIGTLFLLPVFVVGLARSRTRLRGHRSWRTIVAPGWRPRSWSSDEGAGRGLLLATALGMLAAGLVIQLIGITRVFVPQDLAFMGLDEAALRAMNPRLVPLIAHDRAGFGGGLISCGIAMGLALWCGRPSRALWQALAVAGTAGFCSAIGVHFAIGYTDAFHLAPAIAGALLFAVGLALVAPRMLGARPGARQAR